MQNKRFYQQAGYIIDDLTGKHYRTHREITKLLNETSDKSDKIAEKYWELKYTHNKLDTNECPAILIDFMTLINKIQPYFTEENKSAKLDEKEYKELHHLCNIARDMLQNMDVKLNEL